MSEERVPYIAGPHKPEPEEERIFIFTKKQMCEICRKNCSRFDGILLLPDCGNCVYSNLPSMPRKEVVETMARAIYFKACGTMKNWRKCKKVYVPFSEDGLNSILEKAK